MTDDPNLEDALAVADRGTAPADVPSEGLRLLGRLMRIFGASSTSPPEPRTASLFQWGPLEVKRSLGAGSFSEVYAAWDPTLHREVALKMRSPEVGALRWLDEARNLARVRHPHVLTVYGADVIDGRAGIWTELITGHTLEQALESTGPFPEKEAVRIGRDIASALVAVHAAGLVHGDVKTANVMLEDGDTPRRAVLVDFGTADRILGDDEIPSYLMGTPLTMAPEVLDGQPATGSSDVYGLGATLYRILTGRYPIEAETIDDIRRAHASGRRASIRSVAPQVSPRLARVVERALEPNPAQRWPDARAFLRALDDVADPTRRIRARATAIGAGVAALAAVIVVAVLVARPGPGPLTRGKLTTPHSPNLLSEVWRRPGLGANLGYHTYLGTCDLDGDGRDDVVACESRWTGASVTGIGRVSVFRGTTSGVDSVATATITARDTEYLMGMGVARAGDVNHDGFEDVLIAEEAPKALIGRVSLYMGGPRGSTLTPTWTVVGSSYDSGLGRSMMSAGDVNGDGYADVVVGELRAYAPLTEEGVDRLYLGSANGLSATPAWEARGGQEHMELGSWMERTGDVNGDGFDDILLGAQLWDGAKGIDCGLARLYLGHQDGVDATPAWTHEGDGPGYLFGCCVAGAGDVNGDGFGDLLIGERLYSDEPRPERGRALIFYGGAKGPSTTPDWTALGPAAYGRFGFSVAGIGDVDGDGFDDVAIGAPSYTDGKLKHCGFVEVYRGGRNGCETRPAWRVIGDRDGELLGYTIASGDLNGDHVFDVVIKAQLWSDSVPERGLLLAYLAKARPR